MAQRTTATPAHSPTSPFAQHVSDTCAACGRPVYYASGRGGVLSTWKHSENAKAWCPTTAEIEAAAAADAAAQLVLAEQRTRRNGR